jgi:hypothetical protein
LFGSRAYKIQVSSFQLAKKLIGNSINYLEKVMPKELQQTFQRFCRLQRFV